MLALLENVFRNVNIALVNQVAMLCGRMGLVGGHCIPVDPYFLAWKAREHDFHMNFIELAARVNEEMPSYVVNRLMAALQDSTAQGGAAGSVTCCAAAGSRLWPAPRWPRRCSRTWTAS